MQYGAYRECLRFLVTETTAYVLNGNRRLARRDGRLAGWTGP